jgi:hypothetical protein
MKKPDLRIKDDPQIWAKVPRKADDTFDYFYVKLIEENQKVMALTDKIGCGPYDEPVRKKLRPAQKVLALMWRFDSQILNGGVTQFCWNAPFEINEVAKAIKTLRLPELEKLYKKMDARLEEKLDEWATLRNKWDESPESGWGFFQQSYKLLALGWFDKAYLAKQRSVMVKALLSYVVGHKGDFVK